MTPLQKRMLELQLLKKGISAKFIGIIKTTDLCDISRIRNLKLNSLLFTKNVFHD